MVRIGQDLKGFEKFVKECLPYGSSSSLHSSPQPVTDSALGMPSIRLESSVEPEELTGMDESILDSTSESLDSDVGSSAGLARRT